ncbi:MAG: hypothetical protein IKY85_01860 [Bacteroidaceae bacterium]|nr:hypothetical protein [Bacteroidaceae bacterium]
MPNNKISKLGGMLRSLKTIPLLFFVGLWIVLSTYESALLFRINELSVFLFDDLFFESMMSKPAGFLHYISSFFVQFFYYPALGAAIYVALLYAVYKLVISVFGLQKSYKLLALLPVLALLVSNTQLGYWIFYLKQPGYWYMALLATLLFLLALWCFKRVKVVLRMFFVVVWVFVGYPLLGAYALVAAFLMGCYDVAASLSERKNILLPSLTLAVAVVAACAIPYVYYYCYTSVSAEHMYGAGLPITQWIGSYVAKVEHETFSYWHFVYLYWIPLILLFSSFVGFCVLVALRTKLHDGKKIERIVAACVVLSAAVLVCLFWYNDTNFRIENKQNNAMWECKWRDVAEYARDTEKTTRQIVLNKNIALFKLGTASNEMFSYPDGSSDILAPMPVHLTQTGGKMIYFQYGKFNFSYRWCMEDAVEYGWRIEYLKHAARSMLLAGEYRLAQRYIDILKRTMFYRGWAEDLEKYILDPALIEKTNEFAMPLQLSCYEDALGVDESFVEAYLTGEFKYISDKPTLLYIEVALMSAMIRKDSKLFWYLIDRYFKECEPTRLPRYYQEALLLFLNIDKGKTVSVSPGFVDKFVSKSVQRKLESFVARTKKYKGMKEEEMAKYFKDDYADTYFYFYFFVRKIKTN